MKISHDTLDDIAGELDAGFHVYLNLDTGDYQNIIPMEGEMFHHMDKKMKEMEKEKLNEVENNWENYIVLEEMNSDEAYLVMKKFAEQIPEEKFRDKVLTILDLRKPFANFKDLVEPSKYREHWFDFKKQQYIEYVKDQLREYNVEFE